MGIETWWDDDLDADITRHTCDICGHQVTRRYSWTNPKGWVEIVEEKLVATGYTYACSKGCAIKYLEAE